VDLLWATRETVQLYGKLTYLTTKRGTAAILALWLVLVMLGDTAKKYRFPFSLATSVPGGPNSPKPKLPLRHFRQIVYNTVVTLSKGSPEGAGSKRGLIWRLLVTL
jgi:hypothetical protein